MNKTLVIILIILGILLIAYNATMLNFDDLLKGDSMIAVIGILASLCAIVLLLIFINSKRIEKKLGEK